MPLSSRIEPIEIRISESFSPEEHDDLAGGETDPHATRVYGLLWRSPEKHILVVAGEKIVCHVGLVGHTVEVLRNSVSVAGIGGVLVRREYRGRGYCREAMKAAENLALREMHVNFVLLFCRPAMQRMYEHLGFAKISSPVWAEQAEGNVLLPVVSMSKCLGTEQWPHGEVRLGCRPW